MINFDLFQEVLVEEVLDSSEEVHSCVSSIDAVVAVGIELHFELCVVLHQFLTELCRILEMHVVVGQSMADEELS